MNESGAKRTMGAAIAAVAALGLMTGCGSDSGDGKSDGAKQDDKPASTAPAAKPLSASALERAALTKGEVKGLEVQKMTDKEVSEGGSSKSAKADCQPLAALMGTRYDPAPKASVHRAYATDLTKAKVGGAGLIRISSYGPGDAERTVKDLREAVTACRGGLPGRGRHQWAKADVTKVTPLDAPKRGDEAVAFSLHDAGKENAVIKFTVVRTGPQVTVCFGVNIADPAKSEIPGALVDAQVAKVEKATQRVVADSRCPGGGTGGSAGSGSVAGGGGRLRRCLGAAAGQDAAEGVVGHIAPGLEGGGVRRRDRLARRIAGDREVGVAPVGVGRRALTDGRAAEGRDAAAGQGGDVGLVRRGP